MTIEITLTTAQADLTAFDLYSNVDGFSVPFEQNVPVASLLATYTTSLAPNGTTAVRIQSVSTFCNNHIDIVLATTTTTTTTAAPTTTTTTTAAAPTTTTTTTAAVPPSIACNETVSSGGEGITEYLIPLLPEGGVLILDIDALTVEDKLEIIHNGIKMATTGMTVANSGPFDDLYGDPTVPTTVESDVVDQFIGSSKGAIPTRNAEFSADTGISGIVSTRQQLVWFTYTSGDVTTNPNALIRITGPTGQGTLWHVERHCA